MSDALLRMLCGATLGLVSVLLLRRPARRVFGANAAFLLWLLPPALALAPLLPYQLAPRAVVVLPGANIVPNVAAAVATQPVVVGTAQGLLAIWLAGFAVALLRLVVHYVRLLRGLRSAPPTWAPMLVEAAPDLAVRRVRRHDAGPALLWALPHALILLPADFCERFGNAATRELVLRHELTHMQRGDAWWSLAMELTAALLWFHPLAWFARPRFLVDQELACDTASLRALPDRAAQYAQALLDSVAARPALALNPWLAEPQLKERIIMLTRIPPGALRRRAGFLAIAVLLGTCVYVAGGRAPLAAATPAGSASVRVDPAYKDAHLPLYPVDAVKHGQQGRVMLDVTIDASGDVKRISVDPKGTTAVASLQAAALAAAKGWKFHPGQKDGKAVGGTVQVPVDFALPGHASAGVRHAAPAYPTAALKQGRSGTVMLRVHVSADGKADSVTVDKDRTTTESADLIAAATAAARQWRLNPAIKDGKPVAGWVEVPVTFSLGVTASAAN